MRGLLVVAGALVVCASAGDVVARVGVRVLAAVPAQLRELLDGAA